MREIMPNFICSELACKIFLCRTLVLLMCDMNFFYRKYTVQFGTPSVPVICLQFFHTARHAF